MTVEETLLRDQSPGRADHALISVVAPVYNESATLREFVGRLVKVSNSLKDRYEFEFILVDDGSSDDSLDVARSLTQNEPRLRVVELRRNFGQTAA
jgi:glycosyltransferase involved in cell wall biosynthesis